MVSTWNGTRFRVVDGVRISNSHVVSDARVSWMMKHLVEKIEERGGARGLGPRRLLAKFNLGARDPTIEPREFRKALRSVLLGVSDEEIEVLCAKFSTDSAGRVSFDTFDRVLNEFGRGLTEKEWPPAPPNARGPPSSSTSVVNFYELWDVIRDEDGDAAIAALGRFEPAMGYSLDSVWDLVPEQAHLPNRKQLRSGSLGSSSLQSQSHLSHARREGGTRLTLSHVLCTAGNTLAHLAAARDRSRFLMALSVRGARLDRPNKDGDTPATISQLMQHASCVAALADTDAGAPHVTWDDCWKATRDDPDATALDLIISFRRQGGLDAWGRGLNHKLLENHEWWGFSGDTAGFTLAHVAVWKNKPLCLTEIIKGADPNLAAAPANKRSEEVTPLVLARRLGRDTCAALLSGSDPHATSSSANCSWARVWSAVRVEPDVTAVMAVRRFVLVGGVDAMGMTLDSRKLDGFGDYAGFTLAHLAASHGKLDSLGALEAAGADLTLETPRGFTVDALLRQKAGAGGGPIAALDEARFLPSPPTEPVDWWSVFSTVRDKSEPEAMESVRLFIAAGGCDRFGRDLAHQASGLGAGQTIEMLAVERGFRKLLECLSAARAARARAGAPPSPPGASSSAIPSRVVAREAMVHTPPFRPDWRAAGRRA